MQENSTAFFVQNKQNRALDERPVTDVWMVDLWMDPAKMPTVCRRCQPDIFFEGAAEMAAVIEPKLVADAADRQFAVHEQALGFANTPVKKIFHRGKPGFRFENMGQIGRADMETPAEPLQCDRLHIMLIQPRGNVLQEFLIVLDVGIIG